MAAARDGDGERLARVEEQLKSLNQYTHDKWHDMAQVLQPLAMLPERMTRENGKLQGMVEGRIAANSKEIERSFTAAIKEALQPFTDDLREVKDGLSKHTREIEELKLTSARITGARLFIAWLVGTIVSIAAGIGIRGAH